MDQLRAPNNATPLNMDNFDVKGGKRLASSASPVSTALASTNISASHDRRFSSSSSAEIVQDGETPQPSERRQSKLASVFSVFSSRTSSVTKTSTPINDNQMQSRLQSTHNQIQQLSRECERLRSLLSHAEKETQLNDDRLAKLKETNQHCQQLLKRNSDLEQMICEIQTDHDGLVLSLRRECGERAKDIAVLREELKIALEKADLSVTFKSKLAAAETDRLEANTEMDALKAQVRKLRHELENAELDLSSLSGQLENTQQEMARLRSAQREQWSSLGDTSREMAALIEVNGRLENELQIVKDSSRTETDALKRKLATENLETERIRLELESQIRTASKNASELNRLRRDAERATELERRVAQAERDANSLNEKLHIVGVVHDREKAELQNHLTRLNEQLKSYDGVHRTAQAALARNIALEESLREFSKLKYSGNKDLSGEIGPLRDALRAAVDAQRTSEGQLRVKSKEIDLLESVVNKLRAQLQMNEDKQTVAKSPNAAKEARDLKVALDRAIESARQHDKDEISRLKSKYETLLGDIRQSHQSELERQAKVYQEESETSRLDREAELQQRLAAREVELNDRFERDMRELSAAKDLEKERFREQLEKSMAELQLKREEHWQNRLRETEKQSQELSLFYEKKLDEQQRHFESEFQKLRKDFDDLLLEKDRRLSSLQAELETVRRREEQAGVERKYELAREASKLAAADIAAASAKFNRNLEATKQQAYSMRVQFEKEIAELRDQRSSDRNRGVEEFDSVIAQMKAQHDAKLAQMRMSLDKLVEAASIDAAGQVEDLKTKLAMSRKEQEEMELHRREALRDLNDSQTKAERQAAELESWKKRVEDLVTEKEEEARMISKLRGTGESRVSSENLQSLIERNRELENLIGDMSEREHNDMKSHLKEIVQARETITNLRDQLSELAMERKPSSSPSRNLTSSEPTAEELAKAKKERLEIQHELDLAKLRIQSLESSVQAEDGQREREEIKSRLLKKLQDVDSMIRECVNIDQNAERNASLLAESHAARQRLNAEIDYLKSQTRDRVRRIEELERCLRETQNDATSKTSSGRDETQRLRVGLEELSLEKAKMREDCKLLEEQLNAQTDHLTTQIHLRDSQLTQLKESNQKMHGILDRNVDLENEIAALLNSLKQKVHEKSNVPAFTYPEMVNVQEINETLTVFEREFMSRSQKYEKDTRYLDKSLRAREEEIARLQKDLCSLRGELESTFASKTESMRMRFEMERNQLIQEKDEFRKNASNLGRELDEMRIELAKLKEFDHQRIDQMISTLSEKVSYHQQLVAEIQDERDNEVKRIDAQLRASHAAQVALQKQIEAISSDLFSKDNEISDLTHSVQSVLTEVQSQVTLSAPASELSQLNNLGSTFAELVSKVITTQQASKEMMNTLQGLLHQQEAQIQRTEQSRRSMETLVDQSNGKLHLPFEGLPSLQREFDDNLRTCTNARQDVQLNQTSMKTHQRLLDTMREKAVERDEQVSKLRGQLRDLKIWAVVSPTIDDHETTVRKFSAEKNQAINLIKDGVSSLETEFEEIKHYKRVSEQASSGKNTTIIRRMAHYRSSTIDRTQDTLAASDEEEDPSVRKRRAAESDDDAGNEKRVRLS